MEVPSSDSWIRQVTGPSSQIYQIDTLWKKQVRMRFLRLKKKKKRKRRKGRMEARQEINLSIRVIFSVEVTESYLDLSVWVYTQL